jgi:hypothetical protein
MRLIITILAALALTACAAYPPDDAVDVTLRLQARYCAEADPHQRAVALALLQLAQAPIPTRGACADLLEQVPEPNLDWIDVEAAERDAARAREQLEATDA